MSYSDELEALEQERFEADMEQSQLEAAGRSYSRARRKMIALRGAGRLDEAADVCKHSSGYPLNSPAAANEQDPRAGQHGFRCADCGSMLSCNPWDGEYVVLHPCEFPGKES